MERVKIISHPADKNTNESINIDLSILYAKKSFFEAKIEAYKEMAKKVNANSHVIIKGLENVWEQLLKIDDEIKLSLEYKNIVFDAMLKVVENDAERFKKEYRKKT